MDQELPDDPTRTEDIDGPLGSDRFPLAPITTIRGRLGLSVPGAIGGVLLIGALAFGANLGVPRFDTDRDDAAGGPNTAVVDIVTTDAPDADEPGHATDADDAAKAAEPDEATEPKDEPAAEEPAKEPETEATDKPEPKVTPKPTPKPEPKATPKPTPKPEPKTTEKPVLSLSLAIKEGAIFIDWGACAVDGADVYKVVRSTDSTVKWPAGDGDQLIAAVEIGGATKAWDEHAASGKRAWYRVFCVRHTEDGYRVLAATATKSIVAPDKPDATPKPTPHPEPSSMWIEAGTAGGDVNLSWEACGSDGFSHYRILRKAGGDAQVIAEIENASTTTYVDDGLEPGTYQYAVQAKGHVGDDWFLLGTTGWATVTVE